MKNLLAAVELLKESKHGLEIEMLRTTPGGVLANSPHPKSLGSKLTNPYISTDFGEAQLELITPPFESEEEAVEFIKKLKSFAALKIPEEALWPLSVPCSLPCEDKIKIASFGTSEKGWQKEVYRKGLASRYDKRMQSLSGIHYNFSVSPKLMSHLGFKSQSEGYLHLCRNYLRHGWINTYLFGASPTVDPTFFTENPPKLSKYATSIRMSEYGYYSKVQEQLRISYNTLDAYIAGLKCGLNTISTQFAKIGVYKDGEWKQLNDKLLQIEAEHYSRIRPKPKMDSTLEASGIEYVELRALDLQPFNEASVASSDLNFLHAFLLTCLVEESPLLTVVEEKEILAQQNLVALEGRSPILRELILSAGEFLQKVKECAEILDKTWNTSKYIASVKTMLERIQDPELTPSARLLREGIPSYTPSNLSKEDVSFFDELAEKSLRAHEELEFHDDFVLQGYETLHPSTQSLIREAKRRGVTVETLDFEEHFFRLSRGNKVEIIKDADLTSKDPLISYFIMENKQVTKKLLEESLLVTPKGELFQTIEDALIFSRQDTPLVVKPNRSNYGIGINFVDPGDHEGYKAALKTAFEVGQEVIVEEFCAGEEYRFLVVDGKCTAICRRIPANVIGDGSSTVEELIFQKNQDPSNYKIAGYKIKLGNEELLFLKQQGLEPGTILPCGNQIFLRSNSNVSTGGDCIDFTDEIPSYFAEIAVKAAKAMQANICGVDMLIDGDNYSIIECNFNPALWIHRYPTYGKKRYVEREILDLLGYKK